MAYPPLVFPKKKPYLPKEAMSSSLPYNGDEIMILQDRSNEPCNDSALVQRVVELQMELQETLQELGRSRSLVSKLEGLIGSLKSSILHLDPTRGKSLLTGEIAAMEALLFGGGTEQKVDTRSPTKSQERSKNTKKPASESPTKNSTIGPNEEPVFLSLEDQIYGTAVIETRSIIDNNHYEAATTGPTSLSEVTNAYAIEKIDRSNHSNTTSSSGYSDETPVEASVGMDSKASPLDSSSYHPMDDLTKESHPRVVGASYWKEYSSRTQSPTQQASMLQAAMKRNNKNWSMASIFSY